MSIPVRHSGRIAFAALIVIALMAALVGLRLFASAGSETDPPGWQTAPPDQRINRSTFRIGPIDGLTTGWHRSPATTSISLGTFAPFYQPAARDEMVIWTGADEVARDDQGSTAVCWLLGLGVHVVHVEVIPPAGEARSSQSRFNVVDVPIEQITVSPIDVWVDPVQIDEDLPQDEINEQTMGYFFGQSIAGLRELGHGQYRTSVNRRVHMSVEVDPLGFAPLMEWRVDGRPTKLGGSVTHDIDDVGLHDITVGPLLNPEQIEVETYSVTITSHTSGEDTIPDGEPIVFIAETDPPGYEDEITWLSSTKYGTAEPILGEGTIFIAEFNDTWGLDENGVPFQWLGVKADNAVFNQDQVGCVVPNGDFEGAGGWMAGGGPPPAGCDLPANAAGLNLPIPPGRVPGMTHLGWLGNRGSGSGCNPSFLLQLFDCEPKTEPENPHCTITFDARFFQGAGDRAGVILENAGGVRSGLIPPDAGNYIISIPGCVDPTAVSFFVDDPAAGAAVTSVLWIDNVTCDCTDGDQTNMQSFPGQLPRPPGETEELGTVDAPEDCNDNGIPDVFDITDGDSEDTNGNGIPDECEP